MITEGRSPKVMVGSVTPVISWHQTPPASTWVPHDHRRPKSEGYRGDKQSSDIVASNPTSLTQTTMPPRLERRQKTATSTSSPSVVTTATPTSPPPGRLRLRALPRIHPRKIPIPPSRLRRHARTRPPPPLRASNPPLSTVLGSLKRSVSKQRPRNTLLAPPLSRLQCLLARERLEKLRYLHRNPVVRGLVSTPAEYPWSSFQTYATRIQATVKINLEMGTP